jgi:hypothetical protein
VGEIAGAKAATTEDALVASPDLLTSVVENVPASVFWKDALLPGADLQKALKIGERIRAEVAKRPVQSLPQAITVGIGAAAGDRADTLDRAIGRADQALYRAKRTGRNRVVGERFDPASAGAAALALGDAEQPAGSVLRRTK